VDFLLELAWKNVAIAGALALIAASVGRFVRRPALTHVLWLLVLVKLITPPLWHLTVPWPAVGSDADSVVRTDDPVSEAPARQVSLPAETRPQLVSRSSAANALSTLDEKSPSISPLASPPVDLLPGGSLPPTAAAPATQPKHFWITWRQALVGIWIAGSSAWLGVFLVRLRRFQCLAGFATPADDADYRRLADLAAGIGLRRAPELKLINARVPPMTWGFGNRHEMLVPAQLWNELSAAQRDALILHELAHLRRGDHWVRQFELLVFVLHWWHPVFWWARHELQKAEEECCDAWVVRGLPNVAGDYADLIVDTIAYLAQPPAPALPPLASGLGHVRHVRKRLAAILGGSAAPRLSLAAWVGIAATGIFLLPMIPTISRDALAGGLAGSDFPIDAGSNPGMGLSSYHAPADAVARDELDPLLENLAILQLQLIQREAELTEERLLLEQAVRIAQRGTALVARGSAALSVLEESLTEQKIREARVRGREAAVQELKLLIKREETRVNRERQRSLTGASSTAQHTGAIELVQPQPVKNSPAARKSSEEKRLERIEHRLDDLFAEARALADDLKREHSGKE
jgi:beta-lactamase regulating signal transducer with metallopeptidase domain